MSRHYYTQWNEYDEPTHRIVVGWDPPLHTYFYYVYPYEEYISGKPPTESGGSRHEEFVDVFSMDAEIRAKGYRGIPRSLKETLGIDEIWEGKTISLPFEKLGGYNKDDTS